LRLPRFARGFIHIPVCELGLNNETKPLFLSG